MLLKKLLLFFLFCLLLSDVYSQSVLKTSVGGINDSLSLNSFLEEFEKKHPVKFFFLPEWIKDYQIDATYNGKTLGQSLEEIFTGSDITFVLMYNYAVVFSKDPTLSILHRQILEKAIAERKDVEERIIGDKKKYEGKKEVVLSGSVSQEFTNSALSGVTVFVDSNANATTTDLNGKYTLKLTTGEHIISYRYVNYKEKVIALTIYNSGKLDVLLEESPTVLEEVIVTEDAVVNRRVGESSLKITDIKRAPTFLGEVDVIKQIQNQPGVTTTGEVASGFNVRGGGVDQNLVLYDGVPIFNTSHALGFFTAFNADAINQVSFYRGGIPAEYGGRVSSVLNITSKEGDPDRWHGGGGIGIISSYLSIGGPIKKDTTTIFASVRASYSDWMLNTIKSNYSNIDNSSVSFYDGSLKLAHKFSKNTKLTLSGYTSFDEFSFTNDTTYSSGNIAASARVEQRLHDRLFSSFTLAFGKYAYSVQEDQPLTAFNLDYSMMYPSLKIDFNYEGNNHKIAYGLHGTLYKFQPGSIAPASVESTINRIKMREENSTETAAYVSDEFFLGESFFIEAGLRIPVYSRLGSGYFYHYQEQKPRAVQNIIDSTFYKKGEVMKSYASLEPRISLRYSLGSSSSLKLGYNRINQYVHLVTNTAAVTPVDIWQSSNGYFKPQIGNQISLGYYRNTKSSTFLMFTEVFFKSVDNILEFKDGAALILNQHIEAALLPGRGRAYGAEFSITKNKGRLIGTVNYTWSRSQRLVSSSFKEERINKGKWYPSNYDQPHVASLNWRYGISRRHFFSGNFTYHTGRPMSLPEFGYSIDGIPISHFPLRNQYRIPDYHRLDLAFIIEGNHKRKKLWDGTWTVSFYNVYGRKNAYSVFFQDDGNGYLKPYKLSVIGSIVPSLSYGFKF